MLPFSHPSFMPLHLGNIVIEMFIEGGWVMYPIAMAFFIALCALLDRIIWWLNFQKNIDRAKQELAHDLLGKGQFVELLKVCENANQEPFLYNLKYGIGHAQSSMLAAMQVHAQGWLEKSEARMWLLQTMITLAPLLGLFGTVAGLMQSFAAVGEDQLAVAKVSGGIGEALIATACGIAIAILCLLPYNFFRKKMTLLRGKFERWINHSELLVTHAKQQGHHLEDFSATIHSASLH